MPPSAAPPYSKFYSGGWQDGAPGDTPVDAAALNRMEGGISGSLQAPLSPNSGDVPIWNPAANGGNGGWDTTTNVKIAKSMLGALGVVDADVAAGAGVQLSKLNGFPNDATKFARGDGVWASAYTGPKITTSTLAGGPPGSPSDGDIWIATSVNGTARRWQFQYDAAEATAYKWKFIGGPPVSVKIGDTANHTNTTNSTVENVGGLSIAIARAGLYAIQFGAMVELAVSATTQSAFIGPGITTSTFMDAVTTQAYAQVTSGSLYAQWAIVSHTDMLQRGITALAASSTLYLNAESTATGATNFTNMWMHVTPIQVS